MVSSRGRLFFGNLINGRKITAFWNEITLKAPPDEGTHYQLCCLPASRLLTASQMQKEFLFFKYPRI